MCDDVVEFNLTLLDQRAMRRMTISRHCQSPTYYPSKQVALLAVTGDGIDVSPEDFRLIARPMHTI
jgi:hypothetical protein